jgi:hypothetical protein
MRWIMSFRFRALPTAVFFVTFILSDPLEGGVALVAAPFILLTAALALTEDFWGQDLFQMLAIFVDLFFDF